MAANTRTAILFCVITWLMNDCACAPNAIVNEIGKGVNIVKDPIDKTIAYIGSSQCENVKKIIGVTYDQLEANDKQPDLNQLTLEYRTPTHRDIYNITSVAETLPRSRDFISNQNLVIFVHGFTDDPTKNSFRNISDAFLVRDEYSVLALDGSSLISWLYLQSSTYVRFMGEKLGETLVQLVKNGQNPDKITIIGHSLGSHISGFAGKTFQNLTGGLQLGRIVGLDPAGPCFSAIDKELRLNMNDAKYVDAIHTDAGVYGLNENVGHADYYVNGGSQQPDCFFQTCSHSRAWLLFSESVINPHAFPASRCKDWSTFKNNLCINNAKSYMGLESKGRGTFYLRTNDTSPYGLGVDGLRYKSSGVVDSVKDGVGKLKTILG